MQQLNARLLLPYIRGSSHLGLLARGWAAQDALIHTPGLLVWAARMDGAYSTWSLIPGSQPRLAHVWPEGSQQQRRKPPCTSPVAKARHMGTLRSEGWRDSPPLAGRRFQVLPQVNKQERIVIIYPAVDCNYKYHFIEKKYLTKKRIKIP